jgi:hypothetical protein
MAQEPQSVPPRPLRLQPAYQRLREAQAALRSKINAGDTGSVEALKAKQQEVIEFIRAHKESL